MPDSRDPARSGPATDPAPPARTTPPEFERLRAPSPAYAPRKVAVYLCTREHLMPVPFAADADTPPTWECRCGQPATLVPDGEPSAT
jgi:hypothetical protein